MTENRCWEYRLIEEVRKRPVLWDLRNLTLKKKRVRDAVWMKIGQTLRVDVTTCKKSWETLRSRFMRETQYKERRIEHAKRSGVYDPESKYCYWPYFDALKFLANGKLCQKKCFQTFVNDPDIQLQLFGSTLSSTEIDDDKTVEGDSLDAYKLRLIKEIRKRPPLWGFTHIKKTVSSSAALWSEVAHILDVDVMTCKQTWINLRRQFHSEIYIINNRIVNAKRDGIYDPHKKYSCWRFFNALRFLVDEFSEQAKADERLDSDSCTEIVLHNNTDQHKLRLSGSNSSDTESDIDIEIEIEESENDNNNEYVEDDNLHERSYSPKNDYTIEFLWNESDNTSSTVPVNDSEDSIEKYTNFKAHTVSINSLKQDTECAITLKDNSDLPAIRVKQEPELRIESEDDSLEDEYIIELPAAENSNLLEPVKENDQAQNIIGMSGAEINYTQSPAASASLRDEDYSFLHSFLSQMKIMTPEQKLEFRLNVKKLLVHIFSASTTANIVEEQLLLPEDHGPDKKFLISFWPCMKSMSPSQNVQFRLKFIELIFKCLFTGTNQSCKI